MIKYNFLKILKRFHRESTLDINRVTKIFEDKRTKRRRTRESQKRQAIQDF